MTAVGIYARISRDRDADRLGVERQLADCRSLADARRWTVVDEYVDDDVSAYSGKRRPEYERMLADLEARRIEGVIVYDTDRLTRQPRELEAFIDLTQRLKVRHLATFSGDIDLSTHDGQLMARVTGAVNRKESDAKSRRLQRKHLELAEAGKLSGGGTRPFGFNDDRLTLRPAEARLIREAAKRVLAGESIRSIAFDFNERGVPTVTGRPWTQHVVRRMLMSGRISGRREHHRKIIGPAQWRPIITAEQSDALRATLGAPHRRKSRSARRYVLAGMLTCQLCGTRLVSRPRDDGRRRYVCAKQPGGGCGGVGIVADELEALIAEAVIFRLDTPELEHLLRRDPAETDAETLDAKRVSDEAKLAELSVMWAEDRITADEWKAARHIIEQRLNETKRALNKRSSLGVVAEWIGEGQLLRDQWQDLPLSRQQAIIRTVIEQIAIGRGRRGYNRFDPSRVTPTWRV